MTKLNSGAIGEHFGHSLCDLRGCEPDIYDGICTYGLSLSNHAVSGLVAGLLQHLSISRNFTPHDCLEAGHNVAPDMFGSNCVAADDTKVRGDLMARNYFSS